MGRTTPVAKEQRVESVLDAEQPQKPSKEAVDEAFVRLRAFRSQLVKKRAARARQLGPRVSQNKLVVAYTAMTHARISVTLDMFSGLKERFPENYTDVAADRLHILGDVIMREIQDLQRDMQRAAPEDQKHMQKLVDMNERLLLEISEFI